MKNKFFNYILASLLLLTCLNNRANAQTTQAEAKLQSYTIKIGEQTKLFLVVHQPAKDKVNFPKLADTIISKVQVVKTNKPDTTFDSADHSRITVIHSYLITSFDAGSYKIPPFSVGEAGGVEKTNELTLEVQTVKVDTTKGVYDIKQPLAVKYNFWDWLKDHWAWVLLVFIIVLIAVGVTWYLVKRPKKEVVIEKPKEVIPPHIMALNKLSELRARKLWQQQQVKEYHSELTDVLREYLEKRYSVKTYEKTTEEIFDSLRYIGIAAEEKNKLHQILILADLVKFAKEQPSPNENEHSMDSAVSFVTQTQPVVEQPKPAEGGANGPV